MNVFADILKMMIGLISICILLLRSVIANKAKIADVDLHCQEKGRT